MRITAAVLRTGTGAAVDDELRRMASIRGRRLATWERTRVILAEPVAG
jgi:hypothetical protein